MLYQHMTPMLVPAPLFAHQFGWDEILMFVVPIVLALIGVRVAESRAATRQAARQLVDDQEPSEPTGSDDAAETAQSAETAESAERAGDDSA